MQATEVAKDKLEQEVEITKKIDDKAKLETRAAEVAKKKEWEIFRIKADQKANIAKMKKLKASLKRGEIEAAMKKKKKTEVESSVEDQMSKAMNLPSHSFFPFFFGCNSSDLL